MNVLIISLGFLQATLFAVYSIFASQKSMLEILEIKYGFGQKKKKKNKKVKKKKVKKFHKKVMKRLDIKWRERLFIISRTVKSKV